VRSQGLRPGTALVAGRPLGNTRPRSKQVTGAPPDGTTWDRSSPLRQLNVSSWATPFTANKYEARLANLVGKLGTSLDPSFSGIIYTSCYRFRALCSTAASVCLWHEAAVRRDICLLIDVKRTRPVSRSWSVFDPEQTSLHRSKLGHGDGFVGQPNRI